MIGFEWTVAKFFWYLFFMYFTFLYFTFYGMMAVGLTPSYHVASIVSSAFYGIWNLFSGFIIPRPVSPVIAPSPSIAHVYKFNFVASCGTHFPFWHGHMLRKSQSGGSGTVGRALWRGRCMGWLCLSSGTSRHPWTTASP
jgi:hypothetical protein